MTRPETRPWVLARQKFWGSPVPPKLKHGPSTWAAVTYGCDCKVCLPSGKRKRKAWRDETPLTATERSRRSKASKRGQPVPPGVKHGIYAYNVYGHRCEDCMLAKKEADHRRRNPWMYRPTIGLWTETPETTTLHWPASKADGCPDCREDVAL